MSLRNRDEVKGKLDQAIGGVKEKTGRVLNDRKLEDDGASQRSKGKVEEGFGKARRKVGEKVEEIGKAIRK